MLCDYLEILETFEGRRVPLDVAIAEFKVREPRGGTTEKCLNLECQG